MMKLALTD